MIWASSGQQELHLQALLNNYPESAKADEYKLMIIKSYFRFAELSIEEKKRNVLNRLLMNAMIL